MSILDTILWILLMIVFAGGLLLAIAASRRPTSERPGTYWLIAPVVALVATAIVFVAVGGVNTLPHVAFQIIATVILLLIGVVGGSPLVLVTLDLAGSGNVPLGEHGGILVNETGTRKSDREILRGGMIIGYVERLAIIGAALFGQYAAVAVIVAIKGLGRYSELENSAARERFIIGTLVSFVWAAACAAPMVMG